MSKEAALRAMREARYAQRAAGTASPTAGTARTTKAAPAKAGPATTSSAKPAKEEAPPAATDELCGHRSMNGRTCTREKGHTAKSHRYS